MLLSLGILWYVIGVISFVFHWTYDQDFTHVQIIQTVILGLGGPIVFFLGYLIHLRENPKVLIKRRKK